MDPSSLLAKSSVPASRLDRFCDAVGQDFNAATNVSADRAVGRQGHDDGSLQVWVDDGRRSECLVSQVIGNGDRGQYGHSMPANHQTALDAERIGLG